MDLRMLINQVAHREGVVAVDNSSGDSDGAGFGVTVWQLQKDGTLAVKDSMYWDPGVAPDTDKLFSWLQQQGTSRVVDTSRERVMPRRSYVAHVKAMIRDGCWT